jgi:hypothetical protein
VVLITFLFRFLKNGAFCLPLSRNTGIIPGAHFCIYYICCTEALYVIYISSVPCAVCLAFEGNSWMLMLVMATKGPTEPYSVPRVLESRTRQLVWFSLRNWVRMSYISIKQKNISALVSGHKRKWRNEKLHDIHRSHQVFSNGASTLCLRTHRTTNDVQGSGGTFPLFLGFPHWAFLKASD